MDICKCPYCNSVATLQKNTMTIKKGLVKVSIPAESYKCTVCKREFSSHEQQMSIHAGLVEKAPMLNESKDIRGDRKGRYNANKDRP